MCDRWKKLAAPVLGIAALLILWYGVCRAGIFSAYVLPPPAKVLNSFFKMLQTGELWRDVWISFLRVMKGFSIAFCAGVPAGYGPDFCRPRGGYYEYVVQFFRNVPPLSMIPLLILWCGIGETTKTVIIVLASFSPCT